MEEKELFQRLIGAELKQIEISNERILVWRELAKLSGIETVIPAESKFPEFRSNVEAFKYVLAKHPEGLHLTQLIKELSLLNVSVKPVNASGVLRRYVADGKYFDALGGNRFKLKAEYLSENK